MLKKILTALIVLQISCFELKAQVSNSIDTTLVAYYQEKQAKKLLVKKSLKAPALLIGAGILALTDNDFISDEDVYKFRQKVLPGSRTNIDDYIQYAPIAAVYGLNLIGVKGKHDLKTQTALLLKSELLVGAIVTPTKFLSNKLRPDGSAYNTFPSGHTAQAFVAATFLHKEYGHLSPWYSISGYAVATAVGVLRVTNNRHWVSDVLAGAGIGILSTQLVYLLHNQKQSKKKKRKFLGLPYYNSGSIGVTAYIDL